MVPEPNFGWTHGGDVDAIMTNISKRHRSVLQQTDTPAARSTLLTLALVLFPVALLALGLAILFLNPVSEPPAQETAVPAEENDKDRPRTVRKDEPGPSPGSPQATEPDVTAPPETDFLPAPEDIAGSGDPAPTQNTFATVKPDTPWQPLPAALDVLTRIGVGSCLSQRQPQPIWDAVLTLDPKPNLFLMIGDNVYGDVKGPDMRELIEAYKLQGRHPEFSKARNALPFLAVWDDHDYGANDAGKEFPHRVAAARLFKDFWQIELPRTDDKGIYYAKTFGSPGRRVQIIMLDTRSFRSHFEKKTGNEPYPGRYSPVHDKDRTMLGAVQWEWLELQLQRPADIRLLVSSVQVLSNGHGWERWGNLPREREKLFKIINKTNAGGIVLLSGDRHIGGIYARTLKGSRVLPEMTSSSMNRSYGPAQDIDTNELLSELHSKENFGLVDIDWKLEKVVLKLLGLGQEPLDTVTFNFRDLAIGR